MLTPEIIKAIAEYGMEVTLPDGTIIRPSLSHVQVKPSTERMRRLRERRASQSVTKASPKRHKASQSVTCDATEGRSTTSSRGTKEDLMAYAAEIGLPESDGAFMFEHWTSNGWRNGSAPCKDWRSGIRKWKQCGWLPSQKTRAPSLFGKNQAYDPLAATLGKTPDQIGKF